MQIGFVAMLAAALPGAALAQASPPVQAREAFGRCLNRVAQEELPNKLAPDAVAARLKSACATEASIFRAEWIVYAVNMKTRRPDAERDADTQIDDYLQNAVDTYASLVGARRQE